MSATDQPQGSPEKRVPQVPPEEHTGPRTTETTPITGPPRYPDTRDEAAAAPDGGSGRTRWLGICIAVALVLVIVVLHLTGTIDAGGH